MEIAGKKIVAFDGERSVVVQEKNGKILLTSPGENPNVKQLYICIPLFCVDTKHLIVREIQLPKVHGENFQTATAFQAESQIPFPIEEALYATLPIKKEKNKVRTLFIAMKRAQLKALLKDLPKPDIVTCIPIALLSLSDYFDYQHTLLILNLERGASTFALIQEGSLIAAQSCFGNPKEIERVYLYFKNKYPNLPAAITLTGKVAQNDAFVRQLSEILKCPLVPPKLKPNLAISLQEVQTFAPLLGAAINALPSCPHSVNLLQERPSIFKWLKKQMALYLGLSLAFGALLFGFFHVLQEKQFLEQKERAFAYLNKKHHLLGIQKKVAVEDALEELKQEEEFHFPYAMYARAPTVSTLLAQCLEKIPEKGLEIEKVKYALENETVLMEIEFKADSQMIAKAFKEKFQEKKDIKFTDLHGLYRISFQA